MTSIELINDSIIPVETSDKVSAALRQMDELKISHLPVIESNEFLGLIADEDLLLIDDESLPISFSSVNLQRISTNQHAHFYNALQLLVDRNISIVPVTDDNNQYLGSIMAEDFFRSISSNLSVSEPGGIIILQVNEKDFSLAEIARLVESNDVKILSVGVRAIPGTTIYLITLKLNKINIEPVIQTFTRFDYNISTYFGENEKDEELLRNRFDSLMHYLKM